MKPRSIILDLFGDYLRYAGAEIKLGDMTKLLAVFGVEPATVRVSMSRLKKEGWFTTRRQQRETVYELTEKMLHVLTEGRMRIFDRRQEPWPGRWTMVIYQVPETERSLREQLRKDLSWHGFGQLSTSTWVAAHDLLDAAHRLAADYPSATIDVLWCGTGDADADRDLAARCWDLTELAADYERFIASYSPLNDPAANAAKAGSQALSERIQLISDFRRFPFRDPFLPAELRPADWPGDAAFALFKEIHRQLAAPSNAFVADLIGREILVDSPVVS
ncbi:phenylacetic acid degradation operon negative regulatory protein [Arthrobacter ginsengisoli]|uniref:Phenylacetic acid degradation operon negative regulatory protein n=1 Tax=Arthrobacter ginsengisoli TaxID=1356565 RepID=A0ABU1UFI7_9MICC|nr:PaaX family transcriptional regulator C-terminal domain-containing protein [Arthrobacter ginsengisoli]MDR7083890.1 phenylacetic acid degradation operon negative regulatory protein [Arthrobacter ginsengisoli]